MQPQESLVSAPFPVDGTPQGSVCRWTSPDGTQRILIPAALVKELMQSAIQGFVTVPRRGLEVGGLLFGRVRREGGAIVYEIASRQVIPCDHTWGPSYSFGEGDHERFRHTLSCLAEEGSPPVIGFYRSYTGREAILDDGDQELLRRFFPDRCLPCVLLRPESIQSCDISIQYWNSGVAEAAAPPPVVEPEPDPEPQPVEQTPVRLMPPRFRRAELEEIAEPPARRFPWLLPAVCCLLAGLALASIVQVWRLSRLPQEVPLQLNAEQSADGLLLSWGTLPAATTGVVDVHDGAGASEIRLRPDQIRSGNLAYKPATPDPLFRVRLFHDSQELASGSLRVLRTAAMPPAPPPTRTSPPPATSASSKGAEPFAALTPQHQVEPALSPGIRARISGRVTITVIVRVDPTGHVIGAWSHMRSNSGLERYLIDASVQAARSWTFAPPPVQTLTSIHFQFKPER